MHGRIDFTANAEQALRNFRGFSLINFLPHGCAVGHSGYNTFAVKGKVHRHHSVAEAEDKPESTHSYLDRCLASGLRPMTEFVHFVNVR